MANMNFGENFDLSNNSFKRKFRWLLEIPDVCGDKINTLPPSKSARPSVSFKEIEVQPDTTVEYVKKEDRQSSAKLTKYEIALVIGKRAKQIEDGANANIKVMPGKNSIEIAEEELRQGVIPFYIKRPIGNSFELFKLADMEFYID